MISTIFDAHLVVEFVVFITQVILALWYFFAIYNVLLFKSSCVGETIEKYNHHFVRIDIDKNIVEQQEFCLLVLDIYDLSNSVGQYLFSSISDTIPVSGIDVPIEFLDNSSRKFIRLQQIGRYMTLYIVYFQIVNCYYEVIRNV